MLFYTVSFSCWTCNRHCLAALLYRRKHLVRPRWWTHFGQLPDPALQISRLYSYYYVTFRTSSLSKVLRALTGPWLYLVSLYPIFDGCQIMNNVPGNRSHNDVPDQVSVISLRVSIVKSSVPCLGWGLPGLSQNFDLKISHFCGRVGGRTLASCQTLPFRSWTVSHCLAGMTIAKSCVPCLVWVYWFLWA